MSKLKTVLFILTQHFHYKWYRACTKMDIIIFISKHVSVKKQDNTEMLREVVKYREHVDYI